mmetsp:Transcript_61905/g.117207  ORF Transcript_61905/g.117207 Transcript_61905/m.117207 type:complete len:218 (-) Transcript_61905:114-767(-)
MLMQSASCHGDDWWGSSAQYKSMWGDTDDSQEPFQDIMAKLGSSRALSGSPSEVQGHSTPTGQLHESGTSTHDVHDFFPGSGPLKPCKNQSVAAAPRAHWRARMHQPAKIDVGQQPCLRRLNPRASPNTAIQRLPWNYDARGNATLRPFESVKSLPHCDLTPLEVERATMPERSWSTSIKASVLSPSASTPELHKRSPHSPTPSPKLRPGRFPECES